MNDNSDVTGTVKFTGTVEELPFPITLANDANGYETMRVIEDLNKNTEDHCDIHVSLSGDLDFAESWGSYLAQIARAVADQYGEDLTADHPVLFQAICHGFINNVRDDVDWAAVPNLKRPNNIPSATLLAQIRQHAIKHGWDEVRDGPSDWTITDEAATVSWSRDGKTYIVAFDRRPFDNPVADFHAWAAKSLDLE